MIQNRRLLVSKCAVILGVIPVLIYAYDYGPDAGKSGVPGESLCTEVGCHVGTNVSVPGVPNSGPGSVSVTFPNGLTYTPGVKQHLTVTIADPNQREWGFQLTARPSGDSKTQAGTFQSTDTFTLVMCGSSDLFREQALNFGTNQTCPPALPLVYIEHSSDGALRKVPQSQTYEFDWTPPATNVGNITIYVAGNAANGDATSNGDRIYTNKYDLAPAAGGGPPPTFPGTAVLNNASFATGQAVAPGSLASIFGTNLASGTKLFDAIPLSTSMGGVSVTFNGVAAPLYHVIHGATFDQLDLQVPWESLPAGAQNGTVQVVVTRDGVASVPVDVPLSQFSPGIFATGNQAIAFDNNDGAIAAPAGAIPGLTTRPAKINDPKTLQIWVTGLGPVTPNPVTGASSSDQLRTTVTTPTVLVGGVPAQVVFSGLTPVFPAVYQINIVIAPGTPTGDAVPLQLVVGGVTTSNKVTIAVGN